MRTRQLIAVLLSTVALVAAGCSGGSSKGDGPDTSALQARLEKAQQAIADSPGLDISLSTKQLPQGVTGLLSAQGRGYQGDTADDAAFTGDVNVIAGGSTIKAEVVATGGLVYAKTGLTPTFLQIDPATLKAPDPAVLLGAKGDGIPIILTSTDTLKDEGQERDGRTVLTSISGTIKGDVIRKFLPSADAAGTFKVTYRLTDDDTLDEATLRGPFYPGGADVTYDLKLTPTDDDSPITKP